MKYQSSKVIMYVQQLDNLPFKSKQALIKRIKSIGYIKRYALIVHNKDGGKDHLHVTFEFNKKISVNRIAKDIGESNENQFEIMTKRGKTVQQSATNAFRYLIHRTKNAQDKHQYLPNEVKANFNYVKFIEKTSPKNFKLKEQEIDNELNKLLKQFSEGKLSKGEVVNTMRKVDSLKTARLIPFIDKISESKNIDSSFKWENTEHEKNVLWFYGKTGTGKTALARYILKKLYGNDYYESGGNRDVFEEYQNEHGILLDDFREYVMDYNELLKMLDPYNKMVSVSSRYHNKKIQGELYVITCPYNPVKLYRQMNLYEGDLYEQLARRINMIIHFENRKLTIEKMKYDGESDEMEIEVLASIKGLQGRDMESFYKSGCNLIKENYGKKTKDEFEEFNTIDDEETEIIFDNILKKKESKID